ncbi:hypothetical protein IWX90DRAFT_411933 [Phyllosticta citrichinensis]|uniref:Uncharacterized protein n=1 Tax=Phyllosticta citrichinensis TaxID=1130410 RepID=A0ABR1Y2J8_9PEZI
MELDYDQMCSMKDYGSGISCASCNPPVGLGSGMLWASCNPLVGLDENKNNLKRMGSCFVHVNGFELSGVESAVLLPIKMIHGRLANDTTKICPHIRFCDLDLERMKSKHASLRHWPILRTRFNSHIPEAVHGKCKTRCCQMEFSFSWSRHYSSAAERYVVEFENKRQFEMDGPNGRAWLANSEAVPETSASQSGKTTHPKNADLKGSTTQDLV